MTKEEFEYEKEKLNQKEESLLREVYWKMGKEFEDLYDKCALDNALYKIGDIIEEYFRVARICKIYGRINGEVTYECMELNKDLTDYRRAIIFQENIKGLFTGKEYIIEESSQDEISV